MIVVFSAPHSPRLLIPDHVCAIVFVCVMFPVCLRIRLPNKLMRERQICALRMVDVSCLPKIEPFLELFRANRAVEIAKSTMKMTVERRVWVFCVQCVGSLSPCRNSMKLLNVMIISALENQRFLHNNWRMN